jgi:hypothetical protein
MAARDDDSTEAHETTETTETTAERPPAAEVEQRASGVTEATWTPDAPAPERSASFVPDASPEPEGPGEACAEDEEPVATPLEAVDAAITASGPALTAGVPGEVATPPPAQGDSGWRWRAPPPELPSCPTGAWGDDPDGVGEACEACEDGFGGHFVGASVRGRSHKQDGSFCDDAFALVGVKRWRGVVVSDGAGSARFSRVGARLACEHAKAALKASLAAIDLANLELAETELPELLRDPWADQRLKPVFDAVCVAFREADEGIRAWVDEVNHGDDAPSDERLFLRGALAHGPTDRDAGRWTPGDEDLPPRVLRSDCNCTLLVALLTEIWLRRSDGSLRRTAIVIACSVGDGMIAIFRRPSAAAPYAVPLMNPDTGSYGGQTHFLTHEHTEPDALRGRSRLSVVGRVEDILALAAMTDGVADDYSESGGMERLLCDLLLNQLLPLPTSPDDAGAQLRLDAAKAAIREESVLTAQPARQRAVVRYAARHAEATGTRAVDLLKAPALLQALSAGSGGPQQREVEDSAARLRVWLEAYSVRGSFDDRTLAMFVNGAV